MRIVQILALWLVCVSPWHVHAAGSRTKVVSRGVVSWHSDFAKARAESRRRGLPLLVHFSASWCGPCRQMERDVLDTRSLQKRLGPHVVAVKVDTDRNPAITGRYRVKFLPTDLVVAPDGRQLARTQGYQGLKAYLGRMGAAVDRYRAAHPPVATTSRPADSSPAKPPVTSRSLRLGLRGFSPVTLWKQTRWQRGTKRFACRVDDVVYYLTSAEEVKQFRADPSRYVPRRSGLDVVQLTETSQSVIGDIRYAVFYDGGLYLFGDAASLAKFRKSPRRYAPAQRRPRER